MAIKTTKELRTEYKQVRDSISIKERETFSKIIGETLIDLINEFSSKDILCFYPIRSEVNLLGFYNELLNRGYRIYFPKTVDDSIDFYEVLDLDNDFQIGAYGISEPKITNNIFTPSSEEIVITPGLIFDKSCYRVGYGGGYYDRFFSKYGNVIKIGVSFEKQIVDKLFAEEHDVKLDFVVTENNIYGRK